MTSEAEVAHQLGDLYEEKEILWGIRRHGYHDGMPYQELADIIEVIGK